MEKLAHSTPWIPLIFTFCIFSFVFLFVIVFLRESDASSHKKGWQKNWLVFSLSFFLIVSPGVGWRVFFSLESKATMKEDEYILRQQDGHQQLFPIIVENISDYFGDIFISLTWRDRGGGEWNDRNISWLKGWIRKYMLGIWYRQVKGMFNINVWF